MKKTKIICTLGPASDSEKILSELVDAGMNVARLNFSHGTHEEHAVKIKKIKSICGGAAISSSNLIGSRSRISAVHKYFLLSLYTKFRKSQHITDKFFRRKLC